MIFWEKKTLHKVLVLFHTPPAMKWKLLGARMNKTLLILQSLSKYVNNIHYVNNYIPFMHEYINIWFIQQNT